MAFHINRTLILKISRFDLSLCSAQRGRAGVTGAWDPDSEEGRGKGFLDHHAALLNISREGLTSNSRKVVCFK